MIGVKKSLQLTKAPQGQDARQILFEHEARELIFAIVGHVGSGPGLVAQSLKVILESLPGASYDTSIIKASNKIKEWAIANGEELPSAEKTLANVKRLQDLGDKMRETDKSAVARCLIKEIRATRAKKQNEEVGDAAVIPNGENRAYILESIRHPAEVNLLRSVYGSSFTLIGVICEEAKCLSRVQNKYSDAGTDSAKKFMSRDAKDALKHGQRVADALQLSDFFVDNNLDRIETGKSDSGDWTVNDDLSRLVKIITHTEIVRPSISETAMYEAQAAALRSACLSRQVGACLVDSKGNIVALGTNEVPRAGGGLYGESFEQEKSDGRCAYSMTPHCRNTTEQNAIVDKIIIDLRKAFPELKSKLQIDLLELLRESPIGALLEFSRAVHAEMDALLTAGRKGVSTIGTRMWVTTFPCHYCARHIVSAGVDEVQYIEPYQKSKALDLHNDSVTVEYTQSWTPPSEARDGKNAKVRFRHFTGVAPSMYKRAFLKDRDLKNGTTGAREIGDPDWGSPWHLKKVSYVQIEAELARETS